MFNIEVAVNISSQLHRGNALPRLTASRRVWTLKGALSYPAVFANIISPATVPAEPSLYPTVIPAA